MGHKHQFTLKATNKKTMKNRHLKKNMSLLWQCGCYYTLKMLGCF